MNYARCVKFLLERSAPVLFDKVLGQELLTQLVFIREAARSTTDVCRVDVTRGLRLLWGLAVYFKKILPVNEVLDYVIAVLEESGEDISEASIPPTIPNGTTDPDPPAIQELALNILCCILDGSSNTVFCGATNGASAEPDATRDSRSVNSPALSEAHFAGSESHLLMRSEHLLPILREFCCRGLSIGCPPVPFPSGSVTPTQTNESSTSNLGRNSRNKNAASSVTNRAAQCSVTNSNDVLLYRAGLAWRRERRRAKLAARALIYLYRIAQKPNSPRSKGFSRTVVSAAYKSDTPNSTDGDVDLDIAVDELEYMETTNEPRLTSKLGSRVQQTLDEVVETCLSCAVDSPDYVTCLTSLSRVALLLPNVYNRQFKKLITKSLVQQVLVRDSTAAVASDNGNPGDSKSPRKSGRNSVKARLSSLSVWIPDGCIPQVTRAKVSDIWG
ncbi:hypothetical protein FBUS_10215 [Fasciolopsis buskii]|uniref:Uncharacterized protein n=1 Tax=Fasciolopsis buskii TaxID=27845 RepID=A0A8E0RXT3_9TREM|nr:hypothetical protein FBUS_10215 [Fasciolopsis buski]